MTDTDGLPMGVTKVLAGLLLLCLLILLGSDKLPPPPGGHYMVTVDRATGKAEVTPGE